MLQDHYKAQVELTFKDATPLTEELGNLARGAPDTERPSPKLQPIGFLGRARASPAISIDSLGPAGELPTLLTRIPNRLVIARVAFRIRGAAAIARTGDLLDFPLLK